MPVPSLENEWSCMLWVSIMPLSTILLLDFGTVLIVWYLVGFQEEFKDTKGVIRIRNLKKDRQHNDYNNKDQRSNNDLQIITQKTNDRATRTLLKNRG
jgi:hypothetical protein